MRRSMLCLAVVFALLILAGQQAVCFDLGNLGKVAGAASEVAKSKPADAKDKPAASAPAAADQPTVTLPPWTGPKKRLGVMDLDVKVAATTAVQPAPTGGVVSTTTVAIPPPSDFGTGLTEMMTTALFDSKRFILVERKALLDIQNEQAIGTSGMASADSAAGVGKLLGAQALIRGAVTEFTYNSSSTGGSVSALKGIGLGATKTQAAVVLDIRIYDATTGVILDSVKGEGRATASSTSVEVNRENLQMSASGFKQTPLGRATRQAIDRAVAGICARMDKIPWEGRIAEVDADGAGNVMGIYLNAGSETGIKVGDELEILAPGRAITDPETKTVIGRTKDVRIGRCKVETVQKSFSIAALTDGQGVAIGQVVRFPNTGLKAYDPSQIQPATPPATTDGAAAQPAASDPNAAPPADPNSAQPPAADPNAPPAPTN